jgi:malate dehydrogenase (oxaloacetate-decarboxylating)
MLIERKPQIPLVYRSARSRLCKLSNHRTRVQSIAAMSSRHKQEKPHESHPKFGNLPLSTSGPQDCALTGSALLNHPYFNKGSAFPANERKEFHLTGLIPQHVATLEEQVKRAYQQYSSRSDDLAKNTFMTSMKEQNEVLFYRVCVRGVSSVRYMLYTNDKRGYCICP